MDYKNMCDVRVWSRRAIYIYTLYRVSVYLLPDEKLSVSGHKLTEKTAVPYAWVLASNDTVCVYPSWETITFHLTVTFPLKILIFVTDRRIAQPSVSYRELMHN
jgi:hypothetical protein